MVHLLHAIIAVIIVGLQVVFCSFLNHHEGQRFRRQYSSSPFQYQSMDYSFYAPSLLPFGRASAHHKKASKLAPLLSDDEGIYITPDYKEYCPPNNVHRNRVLVVKFFQDVVANKKPTELEKYVLTDLIQHHPYIPNGIEALRTTMSPGGRFSTPEKVTFLHVSPIGDLVWVHTTHTYDGDVFSRVTIARMECGKIAELWNINQQVIESTVNDHPFF